MSKSVEETSGIIVNNASTNAGQLAPPAAHGPKLRLVLSMAHARGWDIFYKQRE